MKTAHLIKKTPEFKKIFKEGRRLKGPHFVLYIQKNALGAARLGFAISKNHCKLATRRNRLRRVAKEFFRQEIGHYFKGYDIVVASRAVCGKQDIKKAAKDIKELLFNAKSMKND